MKNENHSFHIKIPAKLILFGEWAVLDGKAALGLPLQKYFELTATPHSARSLIISSPEASFEWKEPQQQAPEFLKKAQKILNFLFKDPFHELENWQLHFERKWPLEEGLGSSSALFLSLARFYEFVTKKPESSPLELRKKIIEYQKSGSGFDLLIQASHYPCALFWEEQNILENFPLEKAPELVFFHTGQKLKTEVALKNPSPEQKQKLSFLISESTNNFLKNQNWQAAIESHYQALLDSKLVPEFIQELKSELINKKLITTLKSTGAGGGDTLIAYSPLDKHEELIQVLEEKKYWIEKSF